MKTWVRKTLSVGVLAAGALLFGPGVAHADVRQNSYDNNGILNGAQLVAPVSVPVNIVGNAIGVAGEANAAGVGKNTITESGKVTQDSYDNNGIANGLQGYLPVNVPVNVVGNAVAVLGEANAAGAGVNGRKESAKVTEHGWGDQNSYDNNGILNGTQIYAPIDVPINICGNSFALLGEANAHAICSNRIEHGWGAKQNSYDNNGILNGTQVYAPISLPVNLAGNAVGVLGEGNAAAMAQNESARSHGFDQDTHDNNGVGNGLQLAAPISVPINVCGNALSILGEGNAAASCANGDGIKGGHHGHDNDGNGANNGDADDYAGNGGSNGDDDVAGDNGAAGYGSEGNGGSARPAMKSATEASPVGGLTKSVAGAGATNLGGLDLLKTLG